MPFNENDLFSWAKQLLRAKEIIDRAAALESSTAALETRKKSLAAEVADLLAKTETHKQNGAALIANLEGQRVGLQNEIDAQRATLAREKQTHADEMAKSAADHEAIKAARIGILQNTVDTFQREIKRLREQRDELKGGIAELAAKLR